jgi:hypothetical protein
MNELKAYLQNQNRDYHLGIELFKKYGGKSDEIKFLTNNVNWAFLLKKLQNIYRIALQNGQIEVEKPIQIVNKPITVPRKHFSEVETELTALEQTKLLTNKLLSRNWTELDQKEKAYFHDNQAWFDHKKNLLIDNSKIESQLKTTHASLFHATSDEEREQIGQKLVELKKQQSENWSSIDNFEDSDIERSRNAESAHIDKSDLIQRRNNLRARISKAKKSNDPAKLEQLQAELSEIESKL